MSKTYEMRNNKEYSNIENNIKSQQLHNNYLEDIIFFISKQALSNCNNVNEIIRISLKSLTDTVKNQGMAIRDLSKKLSNKPSREEIDNYLKFKPNSDEIFKALNNLSQELEQKINKDELMKYLNQKNNCDENNNMNQYNNLLNRFENLKNDIFNKISIIENNFVNKDDFLIIKNELDNKANIIDIESALETKEDKNKINLLMNNLADKNEVNNMINNSLNKNFGKNEFEQFMLEYENDYKSLESKLMNKLDINDFGNSFEKIKKKVENIDNDLDRLIQSVKDQFQAINVAINNLEQNSVDKNELNFELNKNKDNIFRNKMEKDQIELLINKSNKNLLDIINQIKSENISSMKIFEDKIQNKIDKIIFDNQSLLNDITNTNQNINNYFNQKQDEMENLINRMKLLLNNSNDLYNNKDIDNKINQKLNEKLDISKFEEFLNGLKEDLDNKLDIITMKKTNEEIINEINDKMRQLYSDINKDLSQKISRNDLDIILSENNLQHINNTNNINDSSNEKVSLQDFEDFTNNITQQLKQKLDINKFNNIISTFNTNFENIHKDMNKIRHRKF